MFDTKYNRSVSDYKNRKCNHFQDTYKVEYDENGFRLLVVSGSTNVYDYIQSFAEDVDINKILSRYFGGDISVLDKNKGFYTDVSKIPKSFNDFHNKIVEGQELFNGLPTDFKSMFGNNVNNFVNDIYSDNFVNKYNDYVASKQRVVSSVSVESEVKHE